MVIRRAVPDDALPMAMLMKEIAPEGFVGTEPPVDVEARAARFRETIETGDPNALWALDDDGRIVGNLGVRQTAASGVLNLGMGLLREVRGQGWGRALLRTAIEHARASGAHKLELEVWLDNARAISLYASEGFEIEGIRRDHYRRRNGSLRSTLLMSLRFPENFERGPRGGARPGWG
jgi:ribosomal protein S18 acetylase RimI-like enzyme